MNSTVEQSFNRLKSYCETEGFKGWDPYDGLTSKLFGAIPFVQKNSKARLAWIQLFKRSPWNLRRLTGVEKQYNAKGLALFLTGYCNLQKFQPSEQNLQQIHFLAAKLLELQSPGYSGACWGYYFDWQARAFFQPAHTPTVVATSFAADALWNAYEITGKEIYRDTALSSVEFVLHDLNRTYDEKGNFSFSYSPLDHTQVFNASLLGARLLARAYSLTGKALLKEEAYKAVRFVCYHQQIDGDWAYGTLPYHSWVDSFHTGFNLECVYEYQKYTGDHSFETYILKGLHYYTHNFFRKDGASKYYNNRLYPIDIHAPAQLIVTLVKLGRLEHNRALAEKVLSWTIAHMQDKRGFFYYQKRFGWSSRIPYMRWAQAWMFYSMSYYLLLKNSEELHEEPHLFARHTGA